jgi:hypothetical protein
MRRNLRQLRAEGERHCSREVSRLEFRIRLLWYPFPRLALQAMAEAELRSDFQGRAQMPGGTDCRLLHSPPLTVVGRRHSRLAKSPLLYDFPAACRLDRSPSPTEAGERRYWPATARFPCRPPLHLLRAEVARPPGCRRFFRSDCSSVSRCQIVKVAEAPLFLPDPERFPQQAAACRRRCPPREAEQPRKERACSTWDCARLHVRVRRPAVAPRWRP